jgi:hypothetical protein
MIRDAVEQTRDPLGIQVEGGHLLPEPLGADRIRSRELGLRQLARELEHQLTLLQIREAQGWRQPLPGPTPPARGCATRIPGSLRSLRPCRLLHRGWRHVFQGLRSRGGRITNTLDRSQASRPGSP